jgi:hypothetical protein
MELTYELHKAIKLNYKNTRNNAVVVRKDSKHYTWHRSTLDIGVLGYICIF